MRNETDKRGVLLVLEGIDGAGKSTQSERLAEALTREGYEVVRTREPTHGPWGQKLRASMQQGRLSLEEELELFLADRREHVETLVRPALAAGKVVIVDRYYFSTAAYQGARGLDPQELLARNEAFAPRPDLLVILRADVEVGLARIRARGDQANTFEQEESLRAVARIFDSFDFPYLLRLDAAEPPEQLTARILAALRGPLEHAKRRG